MDRARPRPPSRRAPPGWVVLTGPADTAAPLDVAVAPAEPASDPRRWKVLPFMLAGQLMITSGVGSLYIALPSIVEDLEASSTQLQWISVSYQLMFALTLVTAGRLGDMFGRKRLFMLGLGVFAASSVVAAAAPSAGVLVVARALMGLSGGLASPQILAMIQVTFPGAERRRALASFAAVSGASFIAGQLISGLLIELDPMGLSWRSSFLFSVAVGAVALGGVAAMLPSPPRAATRPPLDPLGVLLLSAASVLVLYPVIQGRSAGWPPGYFVAIAVAVPVFVAFLRHSRAESARGGAPLVDLGLFRVRTFRLGLLSAVAFNSMAGSMVFFVTFGLQSNLGFSALRTALCMAPTAVAFVPATVFASRLGPRLGRRIFAVSGGMGVAAALGMMAVVCWGPRPLGFAPLLVPMFLIGFGQGVGSSAVSHLTLSDVRSTHAGAAAGVLQTVQQSAGALSLALMTTVFFAVLDGSGFVDAFALAMGLIAVAAAALFLLHLAMPDDRPEARVSR